MAITTSTFLQDIVLFLRDTLKSNLVDPLARTDGYVMTSYAKRSTQYPLVTIKATGLNTQKLGISSETSLVSAKIEIRTWARNSKESDVMTQDTINVLRTAQFGTGGTNESQIFGFILESMNPVVETTGDNTIHSKVCTFNYKAILS